MNKIEFKGLNEFYYYEKLDNGLEVYLMPNNTKENIYMTFNTKFGSIYTKFKKDTDEEYITIPNGVAHFLEHLTFKMENGKDASSFFASIGSDSNAFTSFDQTCYEVYTCDKFKENLEYLLDYVQTPYYTEKTVENEKGIICSELKMYEDTPSRNLFAKIYEALFHEDNHKFQVGGRCEDVMNTTKEDIENAYQTFYHPLNMFVVITGNFNPEEALKIIKDNQSKKKFIKPFKIDYVLPKEEETVVKEYSVIKDNINVDKVSISLKLKIDDYKDINIDNEELETYLSMILSNNFSFSSELREELVESHIIPNSMGTSIRFTNEYVILSVISETLDKEKFIEKVKEKLNNLSLTKEELNRKKRVYISGTIRSFDSIESVNYLFQNDVIRYNHPINDTYERLNNVSYDIALKVLNKIDTKNMSIVVLTSKDNTEK